MENQFGVMCQLNFSVVSQLDSRTYVWENSVIISVQRCVRIVDVLNDLTCKITIIQSKPIERRNESNVRFRFQEQLKLYPAW